MHNFSDLQLLPRLDIPHAHRWWFVHLGAVIWIYHSCHWSRSLSWTYQYLTPVASFAKEVNPRSAKRPLVFNFLRERGHLKYSAGLTRPRHLLQWFIIFLKTPKQISWIVLPGQWLGKRDRCRILDTSWMTGSFASHAHPPVMEIK